MFSLLSTAQLSTFIAASVVIAVVPGPVVLFTVARSLAHGTRFGLASAWGAAVGALICAVAAAFGLALTLEKFPAAFTILRWAGGAYLIYLGVEQWRKAAALRKDAQTLPTQVAPSTLARIFFDGIAVGALNPKTILFFSAFLPQFMNPHAALAPQSLALGGLFVVIACASDSCYAVLAGALAPTLRAQSLASKRFGQRCVAGVFLAMGVAAFVL